LQKPLKGIRNIDLENNPISELEGYRDKMFEMFPALEVLDGLDKEGNDVYSDEGDEEPEFDEEGEDGIVDDDEEGEDFEEDEDYDDEEGEEDYGDEEDESEDALGKRGGGSSGNNQGQQQQPQKR